MTENTIECEMSGDDFELLDDKLKALREKTKPYPPEKLTENELQTLKDIAYTLSSVLPKVSNASLFEVDDLIYPDNDLITNKSNISRTYSEDTKNRIIKSCHGYFFSIYVDLITSGNRANAMSRILDTTFFQIIEHAPILKNISLYSLLERLMEERKENELCLALKLLNIVLDKPKKDVMKLMSGIFDDWQYIPLHIKRFQNISKEKNHDKQQIISWISAQVAKTFAKIEEKNIKFSNPMKKFDFLKEECFNVKFIKRLFFKTVPTYFKSLHFDLLYSFFMSAKTEEKKQERLKTFLIGLSTSYHTDKFDLAPRLGNILHVTELFETYLESISNLGYTDDHLRNIDKYHDYKIEPYLNDTTPIDDSNEQSQHSIESKLSEDNISDYTLERILFYDDFMKKLHILNIVHTAYMMSPTLFNKPLPDFNSAVFRSCREIVKIIIKAFFNPNKDGNIPWLLETILKKCPFLILSKDNEHMKDDLIKLLKGEKVAKILEEELFYAVTSTGYKD